MRALRAAARSSIRVAAARRSVPPSAPRTVHSSPPPIRRPAACGALASSTLARRCPGRMPARHLTAAAKAGAGATPGGTTTTTTAATTGSADFPGRCVRVSHILLPHDSSPDPAAALADLAAAIAASPDPASAFADAATRLSACPSGAAAGGDLGWVARGATVPPFEAAAFATRTGGLATAVTDFGHHLLTVTEDKAGPVAVRQMGVLDLKAILEGGDGGGSGSGSGPDAAEAAEAAAAGAEVGGAGGGGPAAAAAGLQLVDVREAHEFDTARLPGFALRPLSAFDAAGLDPAARTVVLCHHGVRSARVAAHLVADLGFTDVWNVAGGIDAYARLADRSVPLY